jgi:hypothetical protein
MNVPVLPARHPDGRLIAGGPSLNAGGRRISAIETARAQLMPDLPKFLARLAELTLSKNESVRLAAIKECLDRLLGKPQVTIEATRTSVSVAELYKAAMLKASRANSVPSEQVVEGKANAASINGGSVGAASE